MVSGATCGGTAPVTVGWPSLGGCFAEPQAVTSAALESPSKTAIAVREIAPSALRKVAAQWGHASSVDLTAHAHEGHATRIGIAGAFFLPPRSSSMAELSGNSASRGSLNKCIGES